MVDLEKTRGKLEIIRRCLNRLEQLRQVDRREFLADFRQADAAKHNLQVAIEAMIDVANHVIARKGYAIPASHTEAFETIAREGWVRPEDVPAYVAMARFRNRIVHIYEDVNDERVYQILMDNLNDFRSFLGSISTKLTDC